MSQPQHQPTATHRHLLPPWAAFALLASIVISFFAGSSATTPLYPLYQAAWGFSPVTTTVIFGVYAFAVLSALLSVGSLSDYVGRRPVLLVAIVVQMVVMLLLATAHGVAALIIARVIQGLSTGAAVGAIGAGLLDLDSLRGTTANAVAPLCGTAAGAIGSGLVVQFLPLPTHLVYLLLLVVMAMQFIGVLAMAESARPRSGALASIRVKVTLPARMRRPLLLALPVLVAAWSLTGFYGAIAPALMRVMTGSHSPLLGGSGLFVLAISGGVTVLLQRKRPARSLMAAGTIALIMGVGLVVLSISQSSLLVFLLGTACAGAGFGAGFQGAIRTLMPLATTHERSGVLSVIYVISYVAMGLPAVLAGLVVVHGGGLMQTAQGYGLVVMMLSALALVGMLASRTRTGAAPSLVASAPAVRVSRQLAIDGG